MCTVGTSCSASGDCVGGDVVLCLDADVCNGIEICDVGEGCVDGVVLDCDDGVGCIVDVCDEEIGCVSMFDHTVCNDGIECIVDVCDPVGDC